MSIRDWETFKKIQRKFKKVLVLSNICLNFGKKTGNSEEYSEKLRGTLKINEKMFKKFE